MGRSGGGRIVAGGLKELRDAIDNYYGGLNEVEMGASNKLPDKPDAMLRYEEIKELGVPLVEGGVMDQPHIFMMEYDVVRNKILMHTLIRARQNQPT